MNHWKSALAATIAGTALIFAGCGDGGGDDATPTSSATAAGTEVGVTQAPSRPTISTTSTRSAGSLGPPPTFGDNVKLVFPAHAQRIEQLNTRSPNPLKPGGVCAEVNFQGLPENTLWFRFALDGVEYTTDLVWVVPTQENPTEGKMCYAPEEGLPVGRHFAAIVVQNPTDQNEPTREEVSWGFEVTE